MKRKTDEEMQEVLASDFSIKIHKETFIDYLEVMVDESGKIFYAIPSHQEWLIKKLMESKHMTREQVYASVTAQNALQEMCEMSHCIALWNDLCIGKPNAAQKKSIDSLRDACLFKDDAEI